MTDQPKPQGAEPDWRELVMDAALRSGNSVKTTEAAIEAVMELVPQEKPYCYHCANGHALVHRCPTETDAERRARIYDAIKRRLER